jgi:nucleoside-diphosphate-sugar epimerase
MNILITGGSGFIGSHLAEHYYNAGHTVFIIDNFVTGNSRNVSMLTGERMKLFEEDICTFDYGKLKDIDLAFHMASPASPIQYKKHPLETLMTNSLGTQRLFEFAKNGGCRRIVIASTSEIYGDPLEHPQKESYWGNVNTYGPRSCYDEGKRFAEALAYTYIHRYNVDIRIIRIFNTYGPRMEKDDGRVISNFVNQAIRNIPITIYGDGTQTRSFCYVSDLVRGFVTMGEKEGLKGEIINVGNPNEKTVKDLAEMVKNLTQSESKIEYHETDKDDPKKRKPDITKAKQILQWEPQVDLEEGLKETITYFKKLMASES